MNIEKLSNQDLLAGIKRLRGTERETTLLILKHLSEIEARGLVQELGYSSLFDYCVRALGYSEASSYRRVSAARAIKLNPELGELFIQGKVNLCTISAASTALRENRDQVSEIVGKSKAQVQALAAPQVEYRPKEVIRPVIVKSASLPLLQETPKEDRYEIRFSVTKEVFEKLNTVKGRMANSIQGELSMEAIISSLIERYLSPKERKSLKLVSNGRYVPRSIKKSVYERDRGQCCYQSSDGTRCCQTKYLHIDHIVPFAKGGKTEISNLRLLCSAHNQLLAEKEFGKEFINSKIKQAA